MSMISFIDLDNFDNSRLVIDPKERRSDNGEFIPLTYVYPESTEYISSGRSQFVIRTPVLISQGPFPSRYSKKNPDYLMNFETIKGTKGEKDLNEIFDYVESFLKSNTYRMLGNNKELFNFEEKLTIGRKSVNYRNQRKFRVKLEKSITYGDYYEIHKIDTSFMCLEKDYSLNQTMPLAYSKGFNKCFAYICIKGVYANPEILEIQLKLIQVVLIDFQFSQKPESKEEKDNLAPDHYFGDYNEDIINKLKL